MKPVTYSLASALLALTLSACAAPGVATTPSTVSTLPVPATALATTVPTEASVPTVVPTAQGEAPATPIAAATLPAPLYFLNDQRQIVRLETDGATHTPITNEPQGIAFMAVSPRDGTILFMSDFGRPTTLVRTDAQGKQRSEILKGTIRGLKWAPDGSTFAVGWEDGPEGSGIYTVAADGAPTLLVKNRPFDAKTQAPGLRYDPIVWSPDGTRLLLRSAPDNGPDLPAGDIAVTGVAVTDRTGQITTLVEEGSKPFLCSQAFWKADGTAIYCAQEGYANDAPPLWRIPVAGGAPETLVAASNGEQAIFYQTTQFADGSIYSFTEKGPNAEAANSLTMQRLDANGGNATTLRADTFNALAVLPALWATDASGAVVKDTQVEGDKGLVWLPVGNGAPIRLPDAYQFNLQWGVK